ncbi:MAG: hypothetical protein DRP01_01790 [Archaeoglobales archaeon]|nr:MAG: hypothetical protein DRP01_01790 [Archaeoglobales archaeon]
MTINFLPSMKWIQILSQKFTISEATVGSNTVTVNETIPAETPDEGQISLALSKAECMGTVDLSGGHDWSSSPENFYVYSKASYNQFTQVTLNQNCPDLDSIVSHINQQLSSPFPHNQYLEAFHNGERVGIRYKEGYEGDVYAFRLKPGTSDALATLGWPAGIYVGESDRYEYSSWSGQNFILKTSLTRTYTPGYKATVHPIEIDVQDIYNQAMDWADNPEGISYSCPMSATGYAPLGGNVYTDKIFMLTNGWKLAPEEGNYRLVLIGTIITDDGSERIVLPGAGVISITFQVSSQGIISMTSGLTESDKTDIAEKVWDVEDGSTVKSKIENIESDVTLLKKVETGRWKIEGDYLIIYDTDGQTILKKFLLKGEQKKAYSERVPV